MSSRFSIAPRLQKPPPVCHPSKHKGQASVCLGSPNIAMQAVTNWDVEIGGVHFHFTSHIPPHEDGYGLWVGSEGHFEQTSIGPIFITTTVTSLFTGNVCEVELKATLVSFAPAFQDQIKARRVLDGSLPLLIDSRLLPTENNPGSARTILHS